MSRSERLLDLLQALGRRRLPVSGKQLAAELGVSIRTLYRDVATLQAQGAHIEGEPGVGYVLRPGFLLPPLMFSEEEIEALVPGVRWVANRADHRLGASATDALAKIAAMLPSELRDGLHASPLPVGPGDASRAGGVDLGMIRAAIRSERKVAIVYRAADGTETRRVVWPFALAFFDRARVVAA
jgi:predicted DNA-binding transcriptional regulator YafY